MVARLRERLELDETFNILKFSTNEPKISILSYPEFFFDPHPILLESVSVDLATGKVRRADFQGRENQPILHRKEAFLPRDHPAVPMFAALTSAEERAGLYKNVKLEAADVMILIVSDHALTSGYIRSVELNRALKRQEEGTMRVIPVIWDQCAWKKFKELPQFNALPKDGKPVRKFRPQDEGWHAVSEGLEEVFEEIQEKHRLR